MNYIYSCLKSEYINNGLFKLQTVQKIHIEKIREWRNSQIDLLRQKEYVSKIDQMKYFNNNVWSELDSKTPNNILLAFTLNDKLIGYGGLVHISWKYLKAESSFILNNNIDHHSEKYKLYINNFFIMLKILAFNDFKFLKITSETFNHRKKHIKLLEEIGFKIILKPVYSNSIFHELHPD